MYQEVVVIFHLIGLVLFRGRVKMFKYEKRLEYPIKIKRTDARMAKAILTQYGGPDGEAGASMRYLSQRFTMPYREVMGILTDIGTSVTK